MLGLCHILNAWQRMILCQAFLLGSPRNEVRVDIWVETALLLIDFDTVAIEPASGWASALRVSPCLCSIVRPSQRFADTRIADAIPLAEGSIEPSVLIHAKNFLFVIRILDHSRKRLVQLKSLLRLRSAFPISSWSFKIIRTMWLRAN